MRLIFAGTPEFAASALRALIPTGHDIALVLTQPDRPAGRGMQLKPSAVKSLALEHGLAVAQPLSLKDEAVQASLRAVGADLMVVAAYGLILPQAVLDIPRLGCLNIHASLLPRWRGAAPIQRAIEAGDAETGITIMVMDEGLDTGPMLLKESVPIGPATTAGALHDALAAVGARLVVQAVEGLRSGVLVPAPQPAQGVTYAKKVEKHEARLDWRAPAALLERRVRAFNPVPGAWFEARGERIRVLRAEVPAGVSGGAPGAVLDERLTVACAGGTLRLLEVQRAGKAPVAAEAFLRGFPIPAGTELA
jgi:methionyl-tRNA formyltransferase